MPLPAYHRRETCRLCGSGDLEPVLSLTPTPPANQFVTQPGQAQICYPLDLALCRQCAHVQLVDVVDPAVLFESYVYVSGTSAVFVRHFERYADTLLGGLALGAGDLVVDIGSNDGTLLAAFRSRGTRILGIDPARAIAAAASAAGIPTLPEFFSTSLARRVVAEHGNARLVTANNVFAHSDDLADIAVGVGELLAADGVFAFEVSYLADVYEKVLFDTIYHEHLAYHSLGPLIGFFARHELEVFDAEPIDTHGGSIRVLVQRRGGPRPIGPSVASLLAREAELGLGRAETFRAWAARIDRLGRTLRARLAALRGQGLRVAGFGAPAKATTLMYHFGLDRSAIDFIVDDSPLKQGLFTPGLHVPVLAPDAIDSQRPDCLLLLAWNFAEPIIARHAAYRARGGRFLVPLPRVRLVEGTG